MNTDLLSQGTLHLAAEFAERAVGALNRELTSCGLFVIQGHGVAWRVKTEAAIQAKLQRNQAINDFIGIRLLATHLGMIHPILSKLSGWESAMGLRRVRANEDFNNRDESGFRSVHPDYEFVDAGTSGLPLGMTVELQLTTWLQHLHGVLSHQFFYKATPGRSALAPAALQALSERLDDLDRNIAEMVSTAYHP